MEFKLEGLDTPIVLPDEYFTVEHQDAIERYVLKHGEPETVLGTFHCIGHVIGKTDLVEQVRQVPLTPDNRKTIAEIEKHIFKIAGLSSAIGDPVVDEVENPPLVENPETESPES